MRKGFTLVEMLVAMAVLLLMVALMAGVVFAVSNAWTKSRAKMDNFAKGRAIIDHFDQELSRAIIRSDLPAFPIGTGGRSEFGFFTQSLVVTNQSDAADGRPLTYVLYETGSDGVLRRMDTPYSFQGSVPPWITPNDLMTSPPVGSTTHDLCEGVYGFHYAFLDQDGNVYDSFQRGSAGSPADQTRAIQVSLFVVNEETEKFLAEDSALKQKVDDIVVLAPPSNGTAPWSPKAEWDDRLKSPVATDGLPPQILAGMRAYERTIPLEFTLAKEVAP